MNRAFAFIWGIAKAEGMRWRLALSFVVTGVHIFALLAQPLFVAFIIREVAVQADADVRTHVVLLAMAMGFSVLLAYGAAWLNNLVLQDVRMVSKSALYARIMEKPSGFFHHHNEGWIEAGVATASQAARIIVYDCLGIIVRAIFFVFFSAAIIFVKFPLFGVAFFIAAVIYFCLAYFFARKSSAYISEAVVATTDASREASDTLCNIDSVRSCDMGAYERNRLSTFLDVEKKNYSKAQELMDKNELVQKLFLTVVFIVFVAAVAGQGDPANAVMLYIIGLLACSQLDLVGRALNAVFEQVSKLGSVLLSLGFYQVDGGSSKKSGRENEFPVGINVGGLSFCYVEGKLILSSFSVQIDPGAHFLITGSSGSGKSTLLKIMTGEIKSQSGYVLFGERNIDDISLEEKSMLMSIISQDARLFNRSIYENASYGVGLVSGQYVEELLLSLKLERLQREGPEHWLEASVGRNGLNLSGGEKQRILLARAILRARPMLFLDEVTSALDEEAEAAVFQVLHERLPNATIVVVSHHPHAQLAGYRRLVLGS